MSTIQARVPTLPTPTTLRAECDVAKALEQLPAVGAQGPPVGADGSPHELLELEPRSTPDATSSIGTMSGGSLDDPGLAVDDRRELRERLQAVLRPRLGHVALEPLALLAGTLPSGQPGDLLDVDAGVPDVEVAHPGEARASPPGTSASPRRLIDCRCLASKPRSRPATAKLATSRFTSHSNGPGSVSSKSLMPNTSRRSGAAKPPKLDRCASPQSCTSSPVRGRAGQIGRHRVGRAAEERERRHQHPPVADRHQLGHARRRLLLEQLDRIAPIRRPAPTRRARSAAPLPSPPCPSPPAPRQ